MFQFLCAEVKTEKNPTSAEMVKLKKMISGKWLCALELKKNNVTISTTDICIVWMNLNSHCSTLLCSSETSLKKNQKQKKRNPT